MKRSRDASLASPKRHLEGWGGRLFAMGSERVLRPAPQQPSARSIAHQR